MYDLHYFKDKNEERVREFINKHPFAFITGCDKDAAPVATQIPVFIEDRDGRQILRGHMMRNTTHHKAFMQNDNVLVVFTGAHCYVSATWYSDPQQASTWNYMSVHARGKIRFLGQDELIDVLKLTSLHFEEGDKSSSTYYDNLAPEYTGKLIHAIAAFEIEILELENVFKLSQNRDAASFRNIVGKLEEKDHDSKIIAKEMALRFSELYPGEDNLQP